MKGNLSRIILGLVALGGISCTTLGLEAPKGVGEEPAALGNPDRDQSHLSHQETPVAVDPGGLGGVAVAGGRAFQLLKRCLSEVTWFPDGGAVTMDFGNLDFSGCSIDAGGGFSCGGGH